MAYIGVSPSNGVRRVHTYTATASQTTFSGAGAEGTSLSYKDSNFVDVYQNGVKLGDADYTSTSGTSIVLAQGASVDDLVVIVVFDVFSAADTVSKADGGTFDNAITVAKDGATALTVDRATSDGAIIDLQKDGSSIGQINADGGRLLIASTNAGLRFDNSNSAIFPRKSDNTTSDNAINLGLAGHRFASLYLGSGVYLGGTGSANLLNDYEEGTHTITFPNVSASPSGASAAYTKIGSVVNYVGSFTFPSSSDSTAVNISIPFTSASNNSLGLIFTNSVTNKVLFTGGGGTNYMRIYPDNNFGTNSYADFSGVAIYFTITYQTSE